MTQERLSSRDQTSRPWALEEVRAEAARAGAIGRETVSDDGAEAAGRPDAGAVDAPAAAGTGARDAGEAGGGAMGCDPVRTGSEDLRLPALGRPGVAARAGTGAGRPAAPRPMPDASWAAVTATCWLATTTR